MKIHKDNTGYITTTLIILMIIPALLLLLITLDQNQHHTQQTTNKIKTNTQAKITDQFKNEIPLEFKKTLSNITHNITQRKKPLKDAKTTIKEQLQQNINKKQQKYQDTHNIQINCTIKQIYQTKDPFTFQVYYTLTTKKENNQIQQTRKDEIQINDDKYPIYDPEPFLKARTIQQKNQVRYKNNPNLTNIYNDAYSGYQIRKCPYTNYHTHNNNNTLANCLDNHYYHTSHDGLCLLCRMENQTTCPHIGLETFIIPIFKTQKSITSIDHVLLNETNQYNGNIYTINSTTFLYLDNGHRQKYGLT